MIKSARRFLRAVRSGEDARVQQLFETVADAERARSLLDDPILTTFFAKQEEALTERVLGLGARDDVERFRLVVAIQSIRQLQEYLRRSAEEGRIAQKHLDAIERGPSRNY